MRARTTTVHGRGVGARRRLAMLMLLVAGAGAAPLSPAQAQAGPVGEYQVKAAFLYNFAKFVEWPPEAFPDAAGPIQLCVLGEDPFGRALEQTILAKSIDGRRLAVTRLNDPLQARRCHVLFISASEHQHVPQILKALRGTRVLTVSETEGFTRRGGMINFVLDDDRVRFEINLEAVQDAHLKMSARLLSVAKVVHGADLGGRS